MSLVKRIISAAVNEINKPTSFVKGEEFERYVETTMFPREKYQIVRKTQDYNSNKNGYVEDSLKPDFHFRCLETNKEFAIEAKFRNSKYNKHDRITWCNPEQLKRYQAFNKKIRTFIVLGLGDSAKNPEEVFIFPVSATKFTELYDSFLDMYSFYVGKPVFSGYLWKLG